ncbi:DUF7504 family protein [Haloplanus aerogenes]|uniref:KaiC/GvpD/RAD55 family RecA-like ATPase n=1 Tax=Haloplanus aerogenes TaxID=660522 RepID=A0A3M0D9V8_9EURY|nr:hypothetical protein [Haloplanus aerogenes]AZH26135.1 hypothetical protein DU502_12545 [Haloplanus aerogenes]RMB18412.1 hypothetical protein ATH50_1867 [Haloplanus aerogenes]
MVAGGGMGPDDDGVSFAHALATLKEQGSALLVVGSVPEEMFADASATMLGDPSADPPRRRLVVAPEPNRSSAIRRLRETGPLSSEYARLVTRGEEARSAAAASRPLDQITPRTHVIDGSIRDLGTTVAEVIEEFDLFAGGLDAAEFRMAFDCLPTMLSAYGRETAFRFVHVMVAQARAVSGLVHFRLPRDMDSELVRLFQPLFDATVELRIDGGELNQRWHFRDRDLTSDWLPLGGT